MKPKTSQLQKQVQTKFYLGVARAQDCNKEGFSVVATTTLGFEVSMGVRAWSGEDRWRQDPGQRSCTVILYYLYLMYHAYSSCPEGSPAQPWCWEGDKCALRVKISKGNKTEMTLHWREKKQAKINTQVNINK